MSEQFSRCCAHRISTSDSCLSPFGFQFPFLHESRSFVHLLVSSVFQQVRRCYRMFGATREQPRPVHLRFFKHRLKSSSVVDVDSFRNTESTTSSRNVFSCFLRSEELSERICSLLTNIESGKLSVFIRIEVSVGARGYVDTTQLTFICHL